MDSIIGNVGNPVPGLGDFDVGLIPLLNNILRLVIIAAGIYTFFLILIGGMEYIGATGDPQKIEDAKNKIWTALLGLVVMVLSFILAVIMGALIFGDPTAILSPKIPVGAL